MAARSSGEQVRATNRRPALLPGVLILALAAGLIPAISSAGAPTERIRGTIDRAIGILKDPAMQAEKRRTERRNLLRKTIAPAFDFEEMARRSLGPNWRGRTGDERTRFAVLFRELLENSYLGKIESYRGEEIRYVREDLDEPYAQVSTLIVTDTGQEIPVNYRLLEKDAAGYRIYDVVIEGISLVGNYRSQFNDILRKSSFGEMMERLRATIRKQG